MTDDLWILSYDVDGRDRATSVRVCRVIFGRRNTTTREVLPATYDVPGFIHRPGVVWIGHSVSILPRAQKYLGSPYPVLGLSSPQMKGIVSSFVRAHRTLDPKTVNALADSLWRGKVLEEMWAGIAILSRYPKRWDDGSWRIVDRWAD